jgi:uncharacterized protein (TIGR02147 family)
MDIFEFDSYKEFVRQKIQSMGNQGRGQFQSIAHYLSVHTTLISHVFSGSKDLNLEQSFALCDYLGFTELEREYFLALVGRDRAGTIKLKTYFQDKIDKFKKQSQTLTHRLVSRAVLKFEDQALFYSEWYFSAVRLLITVEQDQDPSSLSEKLGISVDRINYVLDFLLKTGLLIKEKGHYHLGPKRTHLDASSPLAARHHKNWHLKAMESYENVGSDEIIFTCPVLLDKKDVIKLKKLIMEFIDKADLIFEASGSEKLYCLNIDWVKVNGQN